MNNVKKLHKQKCLNENLVYRNYNYTLGATGNIAATNGSLLLCYWTLGYGKTATSSYEYIVV